MTTNANLARMASKIYHHSLSIYLRVTKFRLCCGDCTNSNLAVWFKHHYIKSPNSHLNIEELMGTCSLWYKSWARYSRASGSCVYWNVTGYYVRYARSNFAVWWRTKNNEGNTTEITMILYESENDNNDADNTNVIIHCSSKVVAKCIYASGTVLTLVLLLYFKSCLSLLVPKLF